ncbi:MAG: glycoside hydrolase family 2 [Treponema sp.]|jgi:beta-galactosidase/beta-glucuronidase|nr:glycoside hydrolase family 2 [Treponema sp.]
MPDNSPLFDYPRPDFKRSRWLSLDGIWDFAFDDAETGERRGWPGAGDFPRKIHVPFPYQSAASGIGDRGCHPVLWYTRTFRVPEAFGRRRIILNFGAVDFECQVWVNGSFIGSHTGGYSPFSFDITELVAAEQDHRLTLKVIDRNDIAQPRGKQYWKEENDRCWYTPCSGIWQSVWIEAVPDLHITGLSLMPDIDNSTVSGLLCLNRIPPEKVELHLTLRCQGKLVRTAAFLVYEADTSFVLSVAGEDAVDEIHYWTPETPNLYDLESRLVPLGAEERTEAIDEVAVYFGMRKISIRDGRILLNNRPLYQRLVLDQAYWEEGLMTPPSSQAFREDVERIKALGFNGVRLHQKIEAPLFYYWADVKGLLVWGEMPSAYRFCPESCRHILHEWTAFIRRDINHPSIICWVPFNESWGVRNIVNNKAQQEFACSLYHLTKALDGSRLISTNDGWEQVDSDICTIHDYVRDGPALAQKLGDLSALLRGAAQDRMLYAEGFFYHNQPILITEFGGIAFSRDMDQQRWGYAGGVSDEKEFLSRLEGLIQAILDCKAIQGYCYTQLTDLMQEINGLAYMNRSLKIPPAVLEKIFSRSPY